MRRLAACLILLAALPTPARAAAPFFTGVGHPSGKIKSIAGDASNTGVVWGVATDVWGTTQPFLWSSGEGLTAYPNGRIFGISADASVLLISGPGGFHLDVGGVLQPISGLYGLRALSDDGATVVGTRFRDISGGTLEAARWTASGGVEGLGFLAHQNPESIATDVSSDGSVIVGETRNVVLAPGFRWTAGTGMEPLDPLDIPWGHANGVVAVSGSGEKIVGHASGEGYVWSEAEGYVALGNPWEPGIPKLPRDVSYAGTRIVGGNFASGSSAAFLWESGTGMRELRAVLEDDYGLDLSGWTLLDANGISPNGRWIVGDGINPAGAREGWVAFLGSPACGLGAELPLVLGALALRRRRLRS